MTGLDLEKDEIVEIAVIVTDSDLNVLDEGLQLVIKPSPEALENMGEFVTKMHEKSGLLPELETGITLAEDSRYYSRMRAARRTDGKYIRNERIADEAYRVDSDPGETDPVSPDEDEVVAEVEATLAAFEDRYGGDWDSMDVDGDGLDAMSDDAKARLQDLGYME